MISQKKFITQPPDWLEAWQHAADKQGLTLSAWIGEQCNQALPAEIVNTLSERPAANRPKGVTQQNAAKDTKAQ